MIYMRIGIIMIINEHNSNSFSLEESLKVDNYKDTVGIVT